MLCLELLVHVVFVQHETVHGAGRTSPHPFPLQLDRATKPPPNFCLPSEGGDGMLREAAPFLCCGVLHPDMADTCPVPVYQESVFSDPVPRFCVASIVP
ncbi:hypothetical protein BCR34DRAFT_375316 [Clohesyomyces aquaticus]|uniref:Uncharacterized protein n=1 Tax=Clohesyomyces aquaticus TaxID=1231657 RepID=A0A1Y1ZG66_9PLEO|nr:hypothetical protein BCR34DRAFT_375316 [Clohesyomyces aquaticus]